MKIFMFFIVLAVLWTGCDDEPGLKEEDLSEFNKITWIKGIWEGKQGDADLYESWRSRNYRSLEGISYTTVDEQRVYIQTMRLEQNNNNITLTIKADNGSSESVMKLKSADNNEAVFTNAEGGFPEKIVYKKGKNKMTVEISGVMGNEDKAQHFEYKKTGET